MVKWLHESPLSQADTYGIALRKLRAVFLNCLNYDFQKERI